MVIPMKKLWLLAVAGVTIAVSPVAAASGFLVEFEDLPLAPGLSELPGGTLFESATGRIVEATAQGDIAGQRVLAFYAETLPQLGWEKVSESSYRRDNELLRISVDGGHHPLTVHFSVVPH
jgi:hypothetical protein